MRKVLFGIIGIILLGSGCNNAFTLNDEPQTEQSTRQPTIKIKDQTLLFDLANTNALRELGLSGRQSLPENNGMLFDFRNQADIPQFWMKDMLFNIDILWIKDNKIIAVDKNVPAPSSNEQTTNLKIYSPPSMVNFVLEVNAGWSDDHNVATGDSVILPF